MMKKFLILNVVGTIILNGVISSLVGIWSAYADADVGDNVGTSEGAGELDEDDESAWEPPKLFIKAINPGYKIDGISNVGEMIEIARGDKSDEPILLAGAAVGYTNSSGNYSVLAEFPEHSWMTGESILLRLASSPGSELANFSYTKTLAFTAGLDLSINGEIIDEVCWTGKSGCYKAFNSANPTTLVREVKTGEFSYVTDYEPVYLAENYHVEAEEAEEGMGAIAAISPQCKGLQFSEILSYYESLKSEQFIEFYNPGTGAVTLDGCMLKYKNKKHILSGVVEAEGYFAYYPVGFSLTKNPTNSNRLEILDVDGTIVDTLDYPNGQRKGTAYAYLGIDAGGGEIWKTTYAPTPGAPNNYQEFKTCEAGKIINEVTGNCVKITSVNEKVCKEGYYLNILTGRCKKITATEQKTCKEGYYLNLETNRCRKIVENNGADYSLEPESYEDNSSFIALYAVLGVVGVGALYLVWEFRHEIAKFWHKIWGKIGRRGG